ncbi:MAG: hypothetical protein ACK4VI_01845 [Alphaproteobacteria bacterium]
MDFLKLGLAWAGKDAQSQSQKRDEFDDDCGETIIERRNRIFAQLDEEERLHTANSQQRNP